MEENEERTKVTTHNAVPTLPISSIELLLDVLRDVLLHCMLLERLDSNRNPQNDDLKKQPTPVEHDKKLFF